MGRKPQTLTADQVAVVEKMLTLHRLAVEADAAARKQRDRRDDAIFVALEAGVSQYRIAQTLGVTQPYIDKLRRQRRATATDSGRRPGPVTLAEQAGLL